MMMEQETLEHSMMLEQGVLVRLMVDRMTLEH
jgi:hypothetical protein